MHRVESGIYVVIALVSFSALATTTARISVNIVADCGIFPKESALKNSCLFYVRKSITVSFSKARFFASAYSRLSTA